MEEADLTQIKTLEQFESPQKHFDWVCCYFLAWGCSARA